MSEKKKILVLSDHALSTSGVGVQSRHLIQGLIEKGDWSFRQLGAAIKHSDYRTVVVNDDFIIKPIDGFGSKEMLRIVLATEKPDAIIIFSDPRFFLWLFEMEDEIHQVCPILWWHVWDNRPTPRFNDVLYEATDAINCHSYLTYQMCSENFPDKTNFIPHSIPDDIFYKMPAKDIENLKRNILGAERENHFVLFWNNRNARRKRPGDLLESWKLFLDKLYKNHDHQNATLIMHTDPRDMEGQNLSVLSDHLGIQDTVLFSTERIGFDKINEFNNISDAVINISYAEGFGLGTLEAMQTGTPIIAVKTGGLSRQVIDHRDGSFNGIPLEVNMKILVGSQNVPYIYEDYVDNNNIANAILEMFELGNEKRRNLGEKARQYSLSEFNYQDTVNKWDKSLRETIDNWKTNRKRINLTTY